MKRIIVFFSLLFAFCYAQNAKTLYISSIEINAKKENGKSWDFSGKKPDVRIEIFKQSDIKWTKVFTSTLYKNKQEIDQVINSKVSVVPGDRLKIKIVDVDSFQNDLVGEYEWTITTKESQILVFGSVKSLSYFLSDYTSYAEYQKALRSLPNDSETKQLELIQKIQKLEEERSYLKQQLNSKTPSVWKDKYEQKLNEYNTANAEKLEWQQKSSHWKAQYEQKLNEYNTANAEKLEWQQESSNWKTQYERKLSEYNTVNAEKLEWQQKSNHWKTQYSQKLNEYNTANAEKLDWQEKSNHWKTQYERKLSEYSALSAEKSKWLQQNKVPPVKKPLAQSAAFSKEEKELRKKLDSIFRWVKYANGNADKLTGYYKQAQPLADGLAKYPQRNKEYLEKFQILKNEAEKARDAKITKNIKYDLRKVEYYLNKNKEWMKYYNNNPERIEKLSDSEARSIVQQFGSNIEMGNEKLFEIEKKYTSHSLIEKFKEEWTLSQKEVNEFTSNLANTAIISDLKKSLNILAKSLNEQITKHKPPYFSPASFKHYMTELDKLNQKAQVSLGADHNLSQEIANTYFLAKKWTVIAYCDEGVKARKDNNEHFMSQSFSMAQKIVGNDKELQKIFDEKTSASKNIELVDLELRSLKKRLLKRIAQQSQKTTKDFKRYGSHFEYISPKREEILNLLEVHKGKALSGASFDKLGWSNKGWFLQHDGMFFYGWDSDIWSRFREIELDHYKIFRGFRKKILEKYGISSSEGRVDWEFPGFYDVKLIAVVDKTTTYVGRKKVRDAYGRVVAQVDSDPVRVVSARIMGIKSKYFTVWYDNDSHYGLQVNDLWTK
ncbi:hypothetical protein [Candidatus Uabimicrobium sp. HlEnr_7]|uniref:hypothetical protein n=1 Tax=Candidatus Uabimicrobium helgolandensis TaxID=3095367 RepID=UPI003558B554